MFKQRYVFFFFLSFGKQLFFFRRFFLFRFFVKQNLCLEVCINAIRSRRPRRRRNSSEQLVIRNHPPVPKTDNSKVKIRNLGLFDFERKLSRGLWMHLANMRTKCITDLG